VFKQNTYYQTYYKILYIGSGWNCTVCLHAVVRCCKLQNLYLSIRKLISVVKDVDLRGDAFVHICQWWWWWWWWGSSNITDQSHRASHRSSRFIPSHLADYLRPNFLVYYYYKTYELSEASGILRTCGPTNGYFADLAADVGLQNTHRRSASLQNTHYKAAIVGLHKAL